MIKKLMKKFLLSVSSDSEFWRCVLYKIRNYFESNPDAD